MFCSIYYSVGGCFFICYIFIIIAQTEYETIEQNGIVLFQVAYVVRLSYSKSLNMN